MTGSDSIHSEVRTSEALRDLSNRTFNSRFRIEIGIVILTLDETFTFDELYARVLEVAQASEVDAPSDSKVRTEIERFRKDFRALARMPRIKGSLTKPEIRQASAFWDLCTELYERSP